MDGGLGVNTLDYSQYRSSAPVVVGAFAVKVNLDGRMATGFADADHFDNVIGSRYNDILIVGGHANWLEGGLGDYALSGMESDDRDLLIGGDDRDALFGGSDEDILIGCLTTHDYDEVTLEALMREWTRTELYAGTLLSAHWQASPTAGLATAASSLMGWWRWASRCLVQCSQAR